MIRAEGPGADQIRGAQRRSGLLRTCLLHRRAGWWTLPATSTQATLEIVDGVSRLASQRAPAVSVTSPTDSSGAKWPGCRPDGEGGFLVGPQLNVSCWSGGWTSAGRYLNVISA